LNILLYALGDASDRGAMEVVSASEKEPPIDLVNGAIDDEAAVSNEQESLIDLVDGASDGEEKDVEYVPGPQQADAGSNQSLFYILV